CDLSAFRRVFCCLFPVNLIRAPSQIESTHLSSAQGEEGWTPNRGELFIWKDSEDENRRIA
ncbi:TPA: hypothetical protein ACGITX_004417, partial [Shigella sonnei]